MGKLIEVQNVTKEYDTSFALRGVSLSLESSEQYVIRGASGSGKSTLLYLLGGLDRPTKGNIFFNGRDLNNFDDDTLASYRNKDVGFVFQFHFLLPTMDCLNNILLPAKIGNNITAALEKKVKDLAQILGVTHCLAKYPYQLSGGEQQRINIIRALSQNPKLLLCDEPTGNLDSKNSLKVTALLKELSNHFKSTLVVVTHDVSVAGHFSNEFYLEDGIIR